MKLIIDSTSVSITNADILLSNSVNIYPIEFEFSDEWREYTKTAVFKKGDIVIEVALTDNKTVIPWEVLRSRGNLQIGIRGVTADKVKPTLWSDKILVNEGVCEGDETQEPTKTHYQAVLDTLTAIQSQLGDIETALDMAIALCNNYIGGTSE